MRHVELYHTLSLKINGALKCGCVPMATIQAFDNQWEKERVLTAGYETAEYEKPVKNTSGRENRT